MLAVRATQRGFDGFALREAGCEFEIEDSKYQPEWMEILHGEPPILAEQAPIIHEKPFIALICEKCGKDFKSQPALAVHVKHCNGRANSELRTDEGADSQLLKQG